MPSWAKFTEVRQGCEGNDEQKWDLGGQNYVKKKIEWCPGPVMLRVPNNNWIGGLREDLDDFSIEDEAFVPTEGYKGYGVGGLSPERKLTPSR